MILIEFISPQYLDGFTCIAHRLVLHEGASGGIPVRRFGHEKSGECILGRALVRGETAYTRYEFLHYLGELIILDIWDFG